MKLMLIQRIIAAGMVFSLITALPLFAGNTAPRPLPADQACPDELFEVGRCTRYVDLEWLEQDRHAEMAMHVDGFRYVLVDTDQVAVLIEVEPG